MKRRKVQPPPNALFSPAVLFSQLAEIAKQGDEQRLTVLISQVETEFPEFYRSVSEMIDLTPAEVVMRLTFQWPALLFVFRQVPNFLNLIAMIQTTIKKRRDEHVQSQAL